MMFSALSVSMAVPATMENFPQCIFNAFHYNLRNCRLTLIISVTQTLSVRLARYLKHSSALSPFIFARWRAETCKANSHHLFMTLRLAWCHIKYYIASRYPFSAAKCIGVLPL
jgi:hypothetical protein